MSAFDTQTQTRLESISGRHPARALMAEKFLKVALEKGCSVHCAGDGYIGINVPLAQSNVRLFHITNSGRLSVLYYMLSGSAEATQANRAHTQSILRSSGLALSLVNLKSSSSQETVDLPIQKEVWAKLSGGIGQLIAQIKSANTLS